MEDLAQESKQDESENAWGEEDDLDLSASERHPPGPGGAGDSASAPDSFGMRTAELEGQLDAVLQQIETQEELAAGSRSSSLNISNVSDEEHQMQAVQNIQEEIQKVEKEEEQQQGTRPAMVVVDHLPSRRQHEMAPSSAISLQAVAGLDDLTRDTGPDPGVGPDINTRSLGDESVYDDENEMEFGPVVDHTPSRAMLSLSQRQGSMAVQFEEGTGVSAASDVGGWRDEDSADLDDDDDDEGTNGEHKSDDVAVKTNKVVDHLPADENGSTNGRKPQGGALSVGVLASMGDSTAGDVIRDADDVAHEFGPVVDLLPITPAAPRVASGTNSMAVQASEIEADFEDDEAMEETCFGSTVMDGSRTDMDGGWDDDDELALDGLDDDDGDDDENVESSTKPSAERATKRASFSAELVTVDHLPSEMADNEDMPVKSNDPSIVALATSEDISRDTGMGQDDDVYDDENELAYGPVVDHTPPTPQTSDALSSGANSMAVHASALKQDIEEDEAMDDSSYHGHSGNDDSTDAMGGGSGWNDYGDDDDDDNGTDDDDDRKPAGKETVTLVDHTPSEMESPVKQMNGDPSVEVLPSEMDTRASGEVDSTGGENVYGLVVDQTPDIPASTELAARSDSVIVQGRGEVDTVDETTANGSTGCEDVVYGPVVDHTPPTPAPSEFLRSDSVVVQGGQDDLGTVDETTVADGDDESDVFVEEQPAELREMDGNSSSVDFIPARPDESRYGDASTLVAADPSEVLSEVDDMAPEEQNFGPVVDLTPPSRPAAIAPGQPSGEGSTVVFVPPSVAADDLDEDGADADAEQDGWDHDDDDDENEPEETAPNPQSGNEEPVVAPVVNEQVVDFVPHPDENFTEGGDTTRAALSQGSTLGEGQSMLQVGDPVEDDFGPVVDQIPGVAQLSSHASTATQLTASECRALEKDDRAVERSDDQSSMLLENEVVVDHLPNFRQKRPADSTATLGRSEGLEDDEEEEEDDTKFGPVVDHLPTSRASLAPSRGGSTVDALATVSEVDSDDDEEGGGWDDDDADFDASLGNVSDGTGLNTAAAARQAARDQDRNVSVRFDSSVNGSPRNGIAQPSTNEDDSNRFQEARLPELPDKSFAEADTPPSTPYRRPGAGSPLEPSDEGIDISIPLLPRSGGVTGLQCETCAQAKTVECPCVRRLLECNTEDGAVVGIMVTPDGDTVKIDVTQLLQDEIARRHLVEKELEAVKSMVESQKLQESSASRLKESELAAEITDLRRAKDELSHALLEHENESASLREQNTVLNNDLAASRDTVAEMGKAQASAVAKNSAFEAEIQGLKNALSSAAESSGDDTSRRLTVTQGVLAAKTGECQELRTRVAQLEESLRGAEKENALQAKETAELSAVLKQNISALKEQLSGSDKLVKTTEQARKELERKLTGLDKEVSKLRASSKQMSDLQIQHEKNLQQQYRLLDKKTSDIHSLEALLSDLQTEKAQISTELDQQRSLAAQSESLANELIAVAQERDLLEDSLKENKAALEKLQRIIEDHATEREVLESERQKENSSLKTDLEDVTTKLACKENELVALSTQFEELSEENGRLQADLQESRDALAVAESATEAAKSAASEKEEMIAQRDEEIEELRNQLTDVASNHDRVKTEIEEATVHIADLEERLKSVNDGSTGLEDRNMELKIEISKLKDLSAALSDERDAAVTEREESGARCEELEVKYSLALEEFEEKIQKVQHDYDDDISKLKEGNDELHEEVSRLQEVEANHAQALEEVEQNAQEEVRQFEESTRKLNAECETLREEISRLKNTEMQQSRALGNLEPRNMQQADSEELNVEIDELRGELARNKNLLESATQNLATMQSAMEEKSRQKDATVAELNEQCAQLRSELSQLQETEAEKSRALEELERAVEETTRVYLEEVASLKAGSSELQSQVERHRATEEQFAVERDRLDEVMRERDSLSEENEEMLVQFGVVKQQIDAAEENARSLQLEIEALRASAESGATMDAVVDDLRSKNAELGAQVQAAIVERDALVRKVDQLESTTSALEELRSKNAELHGQVQIVSDEKDILTNRVEELETSISAAGGQQENLDSIIVGLESQTASLEKQLLEKQNEIDDLQERATETNAVETSDFERQIAELEAECGTLKTTLGDKEGDIQSLKETLEKTQETSDAMIGEIDGLRKDLKDQEDNHARLVREFEEKSSDLEEQLKASQEKIEVYGSLTRSKSASHHYSQGVRIADHRVRVRAQGEERQSGPIAGEYG